MLRRKIRLDIAVPSLFALAAVAFIFVNQAASASTETPRTVWGDKQCLSCHSDLATLKKMQDKKADPTFCQAAYEGILKQQGAATARAASKQPMYPAK